MGEVKAGAGQATAWRGQERERARLGAVLDAGAYLFACRVHAGDAARRRRPLFTRSLSRYASRPLTLHQTILLEQMTAALAVPPPPLLEIPPGPLRGALGGAFINLLVADMLPVNAYAARVRCELDAAEADGRALWRDVRAAVVEGCPVSR